MTNAYILGYYLAKTRRPLLFIIILQDTMQDFMSYNQSFKTGILKERSIYGHT